MKVNDGISQAPNTLETECSVTRDSFHKLFDIVTKCKDAEIIDPNGMRPGVHRIPVGDFYLHAFDGGGGYDFTIVLSEEKLNAYGLMWLDQYPYAIENIYEKPLKEFGSWKFSDVIQLLNNCGIATPGLSDVVSAKCASLCVLTPEPEPFKYDPVDGVLTVCNASGIYIRMNPYDVIEFMYSIQKITNNRYKPYDGVTANNPEDLRKQLAKENYVKMPGPINCEVWGCFSDSIENLLMLEIIYPYTGSRHINVALDLNLYKTTLSV